jgi:hypothetical protein
MTLSLRLWSALAIDSAAGKPVAIQLVKKSFLNWRDKGDKDENEKRWGITVYRPL